MREERERAVERLSGGMGKYGFANVYNDDLRLLLSERAELLAAVERMRGGLESIAAYYPPGHRIEELARTALTTGEATGSPIGQNDQPGLAFSDAGEP